MAGESNKDRRSELTRDLRDRTHSIEILESDLIVAEAQGLGIELEKSSWWLDDVDPYDPRGPRQNTRSRAGFRLLARQ